MGLAARNLTETVSLVVVDPPSDAVRVRLTDGSGKVVDEVVSSDGLVALAGLSSDLTVEAVAADGTVVAACPPDGVLIEGFLFECTLAADATIPVTTIPAEAPNP
jgi:2-keto-3-deoxy-galactonokinase